MNGGHPAKSVWPAHIGALMAANRSTIEFLWKALGLPATGDSVQCTALCAALVKYIAKVGILPPTSDRACYVVGHETKCDVDVHPRGLVRRVASGEDVEPDNISTVDAEASGAGLVQHSIVMAAGSLRAVQRTVDLASTSGEKLSMAPSVHREELAGQRLCQDALWDLVALLANLFRIFPSCGLGATVSGPRAALVQGGEADNEAEEVIARSSAQAQAWVSTVLAELEDWHTGLFREEWFGGDGPLTQEQVRARILNAMSFVHRQLDSIHFVYPADDAVESSCSSGSIAYVWKYPRTETGYHETSGPRCYFWDDPMSSQCALDWRGRYFVYLCRAWRDSTDCWRISTLVHEAIHHTGPMDISYDVPVLKSLPQESQLENAANYQHFAQDVAQNAWGCGDSQRPAFSFVCSGGPCECTSLASWCEDDSFGPEIREQCPGSCGYC